MGQVSALKRCLLMRQDRCLLLGQDRCLLLRQDRCIVFKTGQRPVAIVDIGLVSTADICPVSAADICPVSTADISISIHHSASAFSINNHHTMEAATAADFWLRFLAIASLGFDKIASRMRGGWVALRAIPRAFFLPQGDEG